jgi:hypothetical protein
MPVPCLTMNDIWSTVSDSAATTMSHSFSRCSSSTTMTIAPPASAATARFSAATPESTSGWAARAAGSWGTACGSFWLTAIASSPAPARAGAVSSGGALSGILSTCVLTTL